ncbi:MAG: hypothetical protein EXR72_26680 [Myxococcales bacterium]|nr:hypothetical protein [Myxococcales bacterium]
MRSIADLIPHRPPWSLVDRVLSVEGEVVIAEKRVSGGDPLLGGGGLHGLLVIEALAQTAACLMGARNEGRAGHRGYLVAARGWKFPSTARAGETVTLTARKVSELGGLHGFAGVATVGERVVGEGAMTFAVRFDDGVAATDRPPLALAGEGRGEGTSATAPATETETQAAAATRVDRG